MSIAIIAATNGWPWPNATASRMNGLNFSLFSMNCGAKAVPSVELADVLGAIDDHELALLVEEAGVAGLQPAVRRPWSRASPRPA